MSTGSITMYDTSVVLSHYGISDLTTRRDSPYQSFPGTPQVLTRVGLSVLRSLL